MIKKAIESGYRQRLFGVLALSLLMVVVLLCGVGDALAAPAITPGKVPEKAGITGDVLCQAVKSVAEGTGKALAIVGILILGLSAMYGKISWGQALAVGVGIAVIFGASDMVLRIASLIQIEDGGGSVRPLVSCFGPSR